MSYEQSIAQLDEEAVPVARQVGHAEGLGALQGGAVAQEGDRAGCGFVGRQEVDLHAVELAGHGRDTCTPTSWAFSEIAARRSLPWT